MVKEASPTARILLVGTQKDWDPVDWASQGSEARWKVSPSPTAASAREPHLHPPPPEPEGTRMRARVRAFWGAGRCGTAF